jgi:hypothetical protein
MTLGVWKKMGELKDSAGEHTNEAYTVTCSK